MIEVRDEPLSPSVYTSQMKNISHQIRIFLLWVLFISFFTLNLFQLNFIHGPITLKYWFLALCLITGIAWFSIHHGITRPNLNPLNLDALNQLYCLLTGCVLGIGVYLIHHYLVIKNDHLTILHLMIISNTMLSMIYIMGIIYITARFRYFLWIYIPSSFPAFCIELFFQSDIPTQYILMQDIWFVMIFMGAFISYKNHQKLDNMNIKNIKLFNKSQKHLEESQQLQIQLQAEVTVTEAMKKELQVNNQLLEQKIKERTQDIKEVYDHLKDHQANLDFAHETAGINSWLWNIEKRVFSISNNKSEKNFSQTLSSITVNELNIHPDDLEYYRYNMRQHLRGHTERFETIYRIKNNDDWTWIQDIGKVILRHSNNNKPLRMVGIHRNVQKEMKDEKKIRLATNVFDHVAQGVFVLDKNLCYLDANPFFQKLLGFSLHEIIGKHIFDITVNDDPHVYQLHTEFAQQLITHGEYETEISEEFISGKKLTLWAHLNAIRDDKNKVINYVGIISDLTERIEREQRLSYLENFDLLTDLTNRFYFNQQLHHYVTSKNQALKYFALIRINIDRFRAFNESLSHDAGDELLKQVSERLRQSCSDALLISYLNNDDFAIIYNLNHNNFSIHKRAKIILDAFQLPFTIFRKEQTISISMGIALYPEHGRQIDSLHSNAELALEAAKNVGGNTIHFYANTSGQLLNHGVNLESELRKAIKNNEFIVYYQPKVCIKTNRIFGFEALVRWKHPELGLVRPDMFIPLAEETSLINEIGQFVLFETCKQLKKWQNAGFNDIRVSVNIVAQQIHRGHLLDDIDHALKSNQLSGKMLEIELTESSLLDKSDHVIELLEKVKERHISISLDDFGTGYSSLAYLTNYPIDTLKIDKAFINRIGKEKDEAIINAIIVLGQTIGMTLVAEGVETIEQIEFLKNRGCYIFQGFYYSKPLTAVQSTQYLEQNKLIANLS